MKPYINKSVLFVLIFTLIMSFFAPQSLTVKAAGSLTETVKTKTIKTGDAYTIKRLQKSFTYNNKQVALIYYEYPQLKGSTSYIKSFNKKMKDKAQSFLVSEQAQYLKGYKESAIELGNQVDELYFYKTTTRLTYKSGNVYSFRTEEDWYAGAINNVSRSGVTFNKKTGKYLKVNDVVAGNINEKLVKKLRTNYPELAAFPENIDYVRNKKKFSFYIQNGKAIVCLQPYALVGQGGQYRILGLKLK